MTAPDRQAAREELERLRKEAVAILGRYGSDADAVSTREGNLICAALDLAQRLVDAAGGREPPVCAWCDGAGCPRCNETGHRASPAPPRAAAPEGRTLCYCNGKDGAYERQRDGHIIGTGVCVHGTAYQRAAAAPECPIRKAAERIRELHQSAEEAAFEGEPPPRFEEWHRADEALTAALAAPCVPAGPEPSEAAIDAGIRAEYDHASHMENNATRCVCACGAIFDDKPEIDADDQQRRHWLRETLRAAYAAQFGSPPERGTAAQEEEKP